MEEYPKNDEGNQQHLDEQHAEYVNFQSIEDARLREHVFMSDIEKYKLFRKMMRIGKMLSTAKVTHHSCYQPERIKKLREKG